MTTDSSSLSRRGLLKAAAVAIAAGSVGAAATRTAPRASAQGAILGTVIDYSADVPSAASVKAAGHLGAVRYVSYPRPDAQWMLGKPVKLAETQDFADHGLSVASVYQYGKADTADWKQGAAGAAVHAPQAITLHKAAGGPTGRPIYVAIDDNPTRWQYENQIRPYLQAFNIALSAAGYSMGVYGNYNTIDWAIDDGLGSFFWQHNWGSNGMIHPRVTLHQVRIDKDTVDGIGIDINTVYAQDWGQWKPGQSSTPLPSSPSAPSVPADSGTGSTIPELNINGSSVSAADLQRFSDLTQNVMRLL